MISRPKSTHNTLPVCGRKLLLELCQAWQNYTVLSEACVILWYSNIRFQSSIRSKQMLFLLYIFYTIKQYSGVKLLTYIQSCGNNIFITWSHFCPKSEVETCIVKNLQCKASGRGTMSFVLKSAWMCFDFNVQDGEMITENSDNHTLVDVTRNDTGEYTCSLVDNEMKQGSTRLTVMCKSCRSFLD